MRVLVIGSRSLKVDISKYIPPEATEIISGGAHGIDSLAERWADERYIPKLIIRPDYEKYGKSAPLRRNKVMIEIADYVVAVWDGQSTGTKSSIDYAKKIGKPIEVYTVRTP